MKSKIINTLIVLGLLLTSGLYAQEGEISSGTISKVGTTAGQILKLGVDARSIAMGGAFTAVANDISSIYWNPAGLARIYANEAIFTHTEWLAETSYEFGAVAVNLGSVGTIGAMVTAFNSGDMAVRTVEQPDGTGEFFDVTNMVVGLSYARNLTENFAMGFSVKYIYERIWHMSANSFAVDIGTLFTTPFWGVKLGASISNFGGDMRLDGRDVMFASDPDPFNDGNVSVVNAQYELESYSLPLRFQVGVAKDFDLGNESRVTLAVDAIHPNDNYESLNAGMELGWQELVFFRAGYKSLLIDDTEEGPTMGVGAKIRIGGTVFLKADYAYADFNRLENAQRFSLTVRF
jgi:hypothetical protein